MCSDGLDISFVQSQFGGSGGDGIVLFLRAAPKGSQSNVTDMGAADDGSLYYSPQTVPSLPSSSIPGMPGAVLALGMDKLGE